MEVDQGGLKFVCQLCNKKYSCGKSLGVHMKSHVVANSPESGERVEANMKKLSSFGNGVGGVEEPNMMRESKFGEFGNEQTSYGLRENPKKTWRAVDSTLPLPQEKFCKQCGKGFQSMKALCGHMACHSERDKGLRDDHSWTSENQKIAFDSQSDTEETEERRLRTRSSSRSKRYKDVVKSPNNGSSSVSEIDCPEQEEVAMCLMLLSRDCGSKGGVNSVVESSDNNSVVLETKSSSIDAKKGSLTYVYNQGETPLTQENGDKKLKGSALDAEITQTENSDSDYFLDECANKAESDISVDGVHRNGCFGEYKKLRMSVEGRNEEYGYELRKNLKGIKNCRTALRNLIKDNEYDDVGMASNFAGTESEKREHISEIPELCNNPQNRSKYECFNCKKTFKSYQALGGHRPCHKRSTTFYESRYESGENSLGDSTDFRTHTKFVESTSNRKSPNYADKKTKSKKNKGHVCPFCNRVFKNGQALGGHKRSHFIGGHAETITHTTLIKPEAPDLLDLNLPAPEEDEDDQGSYFFRA